MVLHLYIARRFLVQVLQIFAGFFALMVALDMVEELRRFADQDITLMRAFVLALMNVPATFYKLLPLIVILSAIALFVGLARSSELVVMRASGRSGLVILVAPAITAFLLGAVCVFVLDPLAAATSRRYDVLSQGQSRGGSVLSVTEAGLWLRQGSDEGQTVVSAARANLDGTELYDATFLTFGPDGTPLARVEAQTATLIEGAWAMQGAKRWSLLQDNPERVAQMLQPGALLPTELTRDRIRASFGTPGAIGFWALPDYIADLHRAGFSALGHEVWYQMELAQPLLFAAMVLMAGGFTMGHGRMRRGGLLVLGAVLAGFTVFFLRNFGQVLGQNGQIPVLLAAWAPPLAALLMALGLLLHLEDG
ncbi:LPS export ABC transporter permease LptG [Rhodobacter sp. KR11]|uniref:LPS export ABC transporter permease LptG n=1 Tax=Rhodobacter sp. KR11 TaxID=2974588 RepID=UPI00222247DA|nr:LPS export ABC transporter permease LptG [Rhodobacter sp. KR11]MCW1919547.1 LPS export ABC transporter permease LptG [Rhodobacter sp. KR11]